LFLLFIRAIVQRPLTKLLRKVMNWWWYESLRSKRYSI